MTQTRDDLHKAMLALVQQQIGELPRKVESLLRNGEAILKLQQAGLTNAQIGPDSYGQETISVDRTALPKVRQALGKLRKSYVTVIDADQRAIRVYLEAVAYPGLQIAFRAELPEGSRCRIQTHQYTTATLVCDR